MVVRPVQEQVAEATRTDGQQGDPRPLPQATRIEPLALVQVIGMGIVVVALAAVVRGTSVPAEPPYVVDETQ